MLPNNSGHVGDLSISGATITLTTSATAYGPSGTPTDYPALSGVLFYRKDSGNVGGSTEVSINGNSSSSLVGGMYFPGADATYNGNGSLTCTIIVGGAVTLNGTASLDYTGCSTVGTSSTERQYVRLVE